MKNRKSPIIQALLIVMLGCALGFSVNAVRSDGLPLAYASQSVVKVDDAQSTVDIRDAIVLFAARRGVFVDARSKWEYAESHILGALSLPPDEFDSRIDELRPQLEAAEAIVTYCDGPRCTLGQQLAQKLREAGFANVLELHDGWMLWNNEKMPVQEGTKLDLLGKKKDEQCLDCGQ